jgi:hypothetical protein
VLDCFYDKRVRGCHRGGTHDGIPLYNVNDGTLTIVLGQGHCHISGCNAVLLGRVLLWDTRHNLTVVQMVCMCEIYIYDGLSFVLQTELCG